MDPTRAFVASFPRKDCSANGYAAGRGVEYYFVRLDDRGDLGIYIVADNEADALEEAEEYARETWGPDCIRQEVETALDDNYPEGEGPPLRDPATCMIDEEDVQAFLITDLDVRIEVQDAFYAADHGGLKPRDVAHLRQEWQRRVQEDEKEQAKGLPSDGGPEDVMTSLGYVGMWLGGDVTANGVTLINLEDT